MDVDQIANSFKIRCSAIIDICAGEIGLTEKQQLEYDTLKQRAKDFEAGVAKVKDLTDIMKDKVKEYEYKIANPELTEGAKTYCKKWLKEYLYKRRADVKSKYLDKGNISEEDGFTLMAVQLGLGMVYKNTQFHSNDYIQGTDDLFVKGVVYDNKCSWSLDSFPMFETEVPDERYEWQINGYCDLRGVESGVLAYTLIDADESLVQREIKWLLTDNEKYKTVCNMVYTKDYFEQLKAEYFPDATYNYFVEIPEELRIKKFNITKQQSRINKIYERVKMCRVYIKSLLS